MYETISYLLALDYTQRSFVSSYLMLSRSKLSERHKVALSAKARLQLTDLTGMARGLNSLKGHDPSYYWGESHYYFRYRGPLIAKDALVLLICYREHR